VSQADVVVSESGSVIEGGPRFWIALSLAAQLSRGILLIDKVAVEIGLVVVSRLHRLAYIGKQSLAGKGRQIEVGVWVQTRREGQRVAVIRAVGCMQIYDDVRIPAIEDVLDQAAGFGSLDLHEITIQVKAFCILAGSHTPGRPVLRG